MKHKWLSRAAAVLMAVIVVFAGMPVCAFAADDSVVVTLHYNRPDSNYAGWSVWFWVEGSDIRVVMTVQLSDPDNAFCVVGPEGELTIDTVSDNGNGTYVVTTTEELDIYRHYPSGGQVECLCGW